MKLLEMLETLVLYRNFRDDPLVREAARLLDGLSSFDAARGDEAGRRQFRSAYYALQAALLEEEADPASEASCWQEHVCRLAAWSDSLFSRQADIGSPSGFVAALAQKEARVLKAVYSLDWAGIAQAAGDEGPWVAAAPCRAVLLGTGASRLAAIHHALSLEGDGETAAALAAYHLREGRGLFARHRAFLWDGALVGLERADPVVFDDLIGYEAQKEKVISNTEAFLDGLPGLNMLLYGDRGTGKSSCVKALLNKFACRKLRLVALAKERIAQLPALMEVLAGQGCRFIVFIDDLSFEENETGYKSFKSALEGGAAPQPENVMVCVTSNRRNIIKEVWRDRDGQDDVHTGDAMEEKRSLADRFGLAVTFPAPGKDQYLEIALGVAARQGLAIDPGALAEEAMRWELRGGGKSGRTAAQLVAFLKRQYGIGNTDEHEKPF